LPRASRRLHSPGSAEAFMPACALPWSATVGEQRQRDRVLAEPRKRRGSANGCGRSTRRPRSAKQQSSAATPRRNHPKRNRHERRERTNALPERHSPADGRPGRAQRRRCARAVPSAGGRRRLALARRVGAIGTCEINGSRSSGGRVSSERHGRPSRALASRAKRKPASPPDVLAIRRGAGGPASAELDHTGLGTTDCRAVDRLLRIRSLRAARAVAVNARVRAFRACEVRRPISVEYRATRRAGLGAASRVGLLLGGGS